MQGAALGEMWGNRARKNAPAWAPGLRPIAILPTGTRGRWHGGHPSLLNTVAIHTDGEHTGVLAFTHKEGAGGSNLRNNEKAMHFSDEFAYCMKL